MKSNMYDTLYTTKPNDGDNLNVSFSTPGGGTGALMNTAGLCQGLNSAGVLNKQNIRYFTANS